MTDRKTPLWEHVENIGVVKARWPKKVGTRRQVGVDEGQMVREEGRKPSKTKMGLDCQD